MALDVLQGFDVSATGLGHYLAKRVQVARRKLSDMAENPQQPMAENSLNAGVNDVIGGREVNIFQDPGLGSDPLNFEAFFQGQGEFGLESLLDLSARQGVDDSFNAAGWGDMSAGLPGTGTLDYATLFD